MKFDKALIMPLAWVVVGVATLVLVAVFAPEKSTPALNADPAAAAQSGQY